MGLATVVDDVCKEAHNHWMSVKKHYSEGEYFWFDISFDNRIGLVLDRHL